MPFVLVPVTIQGRIKKELDILWQGLSYFEQQEEQQDLMEQGELSDNNDEKLVFLVRRPELEMRQIDQDTALQGIQLEDETDVHDE